MTPDVGGKPLPSAAYGDFFHAAQVGGDWYDAFMQPDGATLLLDDKSDLLLGVDPTFVRQDHEITLAPGSTLLLSTDGLIERRGTPIEVGIEDLRAALSALAGAPLGALCDNVLETLAPHTGDDDIALIAVRV